MTISSPCIRQCCLNEEDICLGCFRSLEDILGWSAASQNEKQQALKRATERKTRAVDAFGQKPFSNPKRR